MSATVLPLRPASDVGAAAQAALAAVEAYLDRCKLSPHTVKAYKRQNRAYTTWLATHAGEHPDAFVDVVGAEAAVTAWKRALLHGKASASNVNQALAAVTALYRHSAQQLRVDVDRVKVARPGEPDALTRTEEGAVDRAARRRGVRDTAIIAVLKDAGARVEECARLDLDDVAITARTGTIRLLGKGDEVRTVPLGPRARVAIAAWIEQRGNTPGPLWRGQRGRLTISGITQVVLAVGKDAGLPGLRPHRLRHTYATRLRQAGVDVAQVQALLGHATLETAGRYFRPGAAELQRVVDDVFD